MEMRGVVEMYHSRIDRDHAGLPMRLYPPTRPRVEMEFLARVLLVGLAVLYVGSLIFIDNLIGTGRPPASAPARKLR